MVTYSLDGLLPPHRLRGDQIVALSVTRARGGRGWYSRYRCYTCSEALGAMLTRLIGGHRLSLPSGVASQASCSTMRRRSIRTSTENGPPNRVVKANKFRDWLLFVGLVDVIELANKIHFVFGRLETPIIRLAKHRHESAVANTLECIQVIQRPASADLVHMLGIHPAFVNIYLSVVLCGKNEHSWFRHVMGVLELFSRLGFIDVDVSNIIFNATSTLIHRAKQGFPDALGFRHAND